MAAGLAVAASAQLPEGAHPVNQWVKISPLPGGPPSPRLGYEGACAWDSRHRVLIRFGGHNQGGGGEQHAETWTFDPATGKWALKEPNIAPVGICCGQQNVFDPAQGRYVRFPAFSGSHGWQWLREIYLNNTTAWNYDLGANTWRNMHPLPAPHVAPLRCASWDAHHGVIVMFGGEGSREGTLVYDPYDNTWMRMKPAVQPEGRSGGNMAYDAARRVHVLFGTQFGEDPRTWTYDLRKNEWRDMKPAAMPPTRDNDAVLTYDPAARVVLAVVKVTEGKDEQARHRLETWAYDTGENRWTKQNPQPEPDPSSSRARNLAFAPELGLAILENRPHPPHGPQEQQVWTYRYDTEGRRPVLGPQPPTELRATAGKERVTLAWKGATGPKVEGYTVLRSSGARPWEGELHPVGTVRATRTTFTDQDVKPGVRYFYVVRSTSADGQVSAETPLVRVQPRVVEDGVASVVSAQRVELSWQEPEGGVAGYIVERAPIEVYTDDQLKRLKARTPPLAQPTVGAIRSVGAFQRLTRAPIAARSFVDTDVDLSKPVTVAGDPIYQRSFGSDQLDPAGKPYGWGVYAYRVRAVNSLGVESGPSPAILTIPSAPQGLFSKEEGAACHLKWAANREKGLRGYHVYRMDGRYDRDPLPRLTANPVQALTYTDPAAGTATRRYHVVAVDAIGQEGFPTSPVWCNREWKPFYAPFTGEWHQ